jgi:hypothetical protein
MVRSGQQSDPGERIEVLDALLDRLIPADDTPGAVDLALGALVRDRVPNLDNLLERLGSLTMLSPHEQDAMLRGLEDEGDPIFVSLVVTVHELYYADHRSWPSVGYTTKICRVGLEVRRDHRRRGPWRRCSRRNTRRGRKPRAPA